MRNREVPRKLNIRGAVCVRLRDQLTAAGPRARVQRITQPIVCLLTPCGAKRNPQLDGVVDLVLDEAAVFS